MHRDVKPANLFLTRRHTLKILDFGIARLLATPAAAAAEQTATVVATDATSPGVRLGTVGYMAPEQIAGIPADARADVFAFGCVLQELLTGVPPFRRASTGETMSAILNGDASPPPANVPDSVAGIIRRCLQKDPAERFQSASDLAFVLTSLRHHNREAPTNRTQSAASRLSVFAVVAATAVAATWFVMRGRTSAIQSEPPLRRAVIQVPGLGDRTSSWASLMTVSADGSVLVYGTSGQNASGSLHARGLDALDSQPIDGTEGALAAFLSPDGRVVGFERDAEILSVPVSGGAMTRAKGSAHIAEGRPAWTPDGRIVFTNPQGQLQIIHADGSSPEAITKPERNERHLSPCVLPDGRTILFTIVATDVNAARVGAVSLVDRRVRNLVSDGAMTPQYADGFLLYVRPDGALMAVSFDPSNVQIAGEPHALPDRVSRTRFGVAQYAAAHGVIVYVPTARTKLVEVDRSGRSEPIAAEERSWHHPRYSPDGTRIVLDLTASDGGDRDVWIVDRDAKTLSRVTRIGDAHDPSWLPNGREVSFFTFKSGGGPLAIASADGAGDPQPVRIGRGFTSTDLIDSGGWLPDGSAYVGGVSDHGGPADIWRIPRAGGDPVKLAGSSYNELAPSVSPDGRMLLYQSDETGRMEVYIRSIASGEGRVQVSNNGGTEPVWDRKGAGIYYVEALGDRRRLISATLRQSSPFAIANRSVVVPDLRLDESDNHPNYDVHPSGDRFVIPELQATPGLVAVFDWSKRARDQR